MAIDRIAAASFGRLRPPISGKKAFELQFHWIFVLIAGALILAFFFSVAQKQRQYSQEKLQLTLATDIENIFTGAIASRGTAQTLPVPPQGIAFECSEGCSCEFRIEKAPRQFGDKAMFAPEILKDQEIVVWSLELKMPYRVINFLYLTNPNIKYYFVHQEEGFSQSLLKQLTKNMPSLLQYENITVTELTSLKAEDYQHTKFVFLNVEPSVSLDESLEKKSFSGIKVDQNGIAFYEKDDNKFSRIKYLSYVGLPSIYAAMFAQDHVMYECGLRTAFRKLAYVSLLYAERAAELQQKSFEAGRDCDYGASLSSTDVCKDTTPSTAVGMLCEQHKYGQALANKIDDKFVARLSPLKEQLDSANRNFLAQSCPEMF